MYKLTEEKLEPMLPFLLLGLGTLYEDNQGIAGVRLLKNHVLRLFGQKVEDIHPDVLNLIHWCDHYMLVKSAKNLLRIDCDKKYRLFFLDRSVSRDVLRVSMEEMKREARECNEFLNMLRRLFDQEELWEDRDFSFVFEQLSFFEGSLKCIPFLENDIWDIYDVH